MSTTPTQQTAEIEQLRTELREANRNIEKLKEIRSDVLSRMSHELKTPLTTILGFAEVLLEPEEYDMETIQDFAQEIHQQARRMHMITEDMINLARMEAGMMEYNRSVVDLADLSERVVSEYRSECEHQEIELLLELDGGGPLRVDQEKLEQVLRSLLRNAMEATPTGGRITIATEEDPAQCRIIVADTGKGIAAEDLIQIFEKFTQVEDILHHHEGLGLGLALSSRIIEDGHHGEITVHSEGLGHGTKFVIHLPR